MALVHFHLSFCPFVFRPSSLVSIFALTFPSGWLRFTLHTSRFTFFPPPWGSWRGLPFIPLFSFTFFHTPTEALLWIQLVAEGSLSFQRRLGVAMAKARRDNVEGSAF